MLALVEMCEGQCASSLIKCGGKKFADLGVTSLALTGCNLECFKMGGDSNKKTLDYLLAGGTSGMIARTCIAPIERIKILFQIQKGSSSYVKLLTDVLKKEGIKSMWKGNSAAVIRVIPYTSIQFSSFEEYSSALRKFESLPKTPRDLTAGSLAGLTACATTYPLDVVRARMALQNEGLANTRFEGWF